MSSIIFRHIDFNYDSPQREVFRDLSLLIDTHWKAALIGRNGKGKTTLLKLISGDLTIEKGTIEISERTCLFPYAVPDGSLSTFAVIKDAVGPFRWWEQRMETLSGKVDESSLRKYTQLQEQYQQAGGYEINAHISKEAELIGMKSMLLDRPFNSLSGGEQTRGLIAALFLKRDHYPLIDEPTNHLDMQGRDQLATYLNSKGGFLLVSHDRYLLDNCVDHVISINRGDVRVNQGNYSDWHDQMDREDTYEGRRKRNLKRDIKQLRGAAQQRRSGSLAREREKKGAVDKGFVGHRAAKQMRRALSMERRIHKQLDEKQSLLKNEEKERTLKIETGAGSSRSLLTINNLSISRDGRTIFSGLSMQLEQGDRIGIVGRNGSGKTSLFDVICGDLGSFSGTLKKPAHVRFNRAFQNTRWQSGNLRDKLIASGLEETRFRQFMGAYGVEGEVFEQPLETFSLGQLKKIDLIRSLLFAADVLIWDEPLNYVDVISRAQIETAIIRDQPTLLFTDHDRYFVEQVATQIIDLDGLSHPR